MKCNRSSLYYEPKGESKENLELMEAMDKYYLGHPTAGVRTMVNMFLLQGKAVNAKRIRRLMRKMNLVPIYPQRSLSKGGRPKCFHPYLLRDIDITHANQIWSTDISYVPMENGFMYLYAVIDVYSRYIVGWRLSNTLTASNCHELIEECIKEHGAPEIINSDQGSQYTTRQWEDLLRANGVKISMDGKGRCKDNIWIERFWRTIKQEYIYLNPSSSVEQLRKGIADFIKFYNEERPHQSLAKLLPVLEYNKAA